MSHASSSLSSVFLDVAESDGGIYSCNLHHHYCHLYETVKIQLDVTKKGGCATAWGPSRQGAGSGSWSPVAPSTVLNSGICVLSHRRYCVLCCSCQRGAAWVKGFVLASQCRFRAQVPRESCGACWAVFCFLTPQVSVF